MRLRLFLTSGLTCPFIFAAPVPGRGEYEKTCPPEKVHLFYKFERLCKFFIGFAGEACR